MPMHQGLSLRTSQHLALTPQLQQSIRLLQLSTLELAQEVEQQLADNPFLERDPEPAETDTPGLPHADTPVSLGDRLSEPPAGIAADLPAPASRQDSDGHSENPGDAALHDGHAEEPHPDSPALDWDGDGSVDIAPHDSEWGNDAPAATMHSSGSHGGYALGNNSVYIFHDNSDSLQLVDLKTLLSLMLLNQTIWRRLFSGSPK